jgi:hypothetical protein
LTNLKSEAETKEETKKIIDNLFENLKKIENRNSLANYQAIFSRIIRLDKTMNKIESFIFLVDPIENETSESIAKKKSMFSILAFVFVFDCYVTLLDIVIYLLILDNHDLYDVEKQNYVHTIDDIARISVETKFKFLEEHKLELFVRRPDQELRNKIAHNNFEIIDNKNGVVEYKSKKYSVKEQSVDLLSFIVQLGEQIVSTGNKHP